MKTLDERVRYRTNIELGKIDYGNQSHRKINQVSIDIELRDEEWGKELSICGNIWNGNHTDIVSGGQNLEEIAKLFPYNKKVQRIVEVWKRWHLNGLHAGCEHQRAQGWSEARLDDSRPAIHGNLAGWVYKKDHPKGLLCEPCSVCGYKYGTEWKHEQMPTEIIEEVKSW